MSYSVKQANPWARFGEGIGKGLGDQIPKEVERYRLSSGLKNFAENSKDMSPMDRMIGLLSIPGVPDRPQLIQTLGELTRLDAKGKALRPKEGEPRGNEPQNKNERINPRSIEGASPNPEMQEGLKGEGKNNQQSYMEKTSLSPDEIPSLVSKNTVESQLNPEIPRSEEEIRQDAMEREDYQYDPTGAIEDERIKDARRVARGKSLIDKGERELSIQKGITGDLREKAGTFGGIGPKGIPENVYQDIENKAIQDVDERKLTPDQVIKKYTKEIDQIGREYEDLRGIGSYSAVWGDPKATLNSMKQIKKGFKERGDEENFIETLVGQNRHSYPFAYSQAYPVNEDKKVYSILKGLKKIDPVLGIAPSQKIQNKIMDDIISNITNESSILSIASYLYRKGYDKNLFMEKLGDKRDSLSGKQLKEMRKPWAPLNMQDLFMYSVIGVE